MKRLAALVVLALFGCHHTASFTTELPPRTIWVSPPLFKEEIKPMQLEKESDGWWLVRIETAASDKVGPDDSLKHKYILYFERFED